ncbi:MAG TPA: hypothetical protein VFR28_02830 [Allosphingosinicella sp.]|jgi:hypothetical protein|nr:hypothetical protein [Allosphingosinicella sp.]
MRKSSYLIALALFGVSSTALGQTTLPLNTGFDNSNFTVYPLPTGSGSVSDNYWIKVASSHPPGPAPAFVINPHPAWQPPLSGGGFGSQWISSTSPNGTSPSGQLNYAIYRKCFCLMPGYKQAQMSFKILGDDMIGVWLNSIGGNILPIQGGAFSGPAINGAAYAGQFRTGRNCLYVLVVDTGSVVTGFDLAGTVSAYGLMPMASAGAAASFKPCTCEGPATASETATIKALANVAKAAASKPGPVPVQIDRPRTR